MIASSSTRFWIAEYATFRFSGSVKPATAAGSPAGRNHRVSHTDPECTQEAAPTRQLASAGSSAARLVRQAGRLVRKMHRRQEFDTPEWRFLRRRRELSKPQILDGRDCSDGGALWSTVAIVAALCRGCSWSVAVNFRSVRSALRTTLVVRVAVHACRPNAPNAAPPRPPASQPFASPHGTSASP